MIEVIVGLGFVLFLLITYLVVYTVVSNLFK